MYARPIPVQTKVQFENLKFLAATYDLGVLSYAFDFVPFFKRFLETEMTLSQPSMPFQESKLMFRVTFKDKSGTNQILRQLRNDVKYE